MARVLASPFGRLGPQRRQGGADWSPPASGYHLYYPRRRQLDRAFTLATSAVVREFIRHRLDAVRRRHPTAPTDQNRFVSWIPKVRGSFTKAVRLLKSIAPMTLASSVRFRT